MIALLTIVHVFVCLFLILVVLLQTGKGADIAAAFGGSSQTAFGARGASTLLSKMTTISAVVFMFSSMTLALLSTGPSRSVVDTAPASQQAPAQPAGPATPAPLPAQGTAESGTPAPPAGSAQAPAAGQETAQPPAEPPKP